ncbi:helix-turn-helix domain-containing protein [Streptosporangium sp. NPDC087985]|uniref:helix-turn-helix domain-containing protein n=1 Tax=Streptosporangium sp. NPDC087985 TaxID=3366196 RepID=UPI0037F8C14B
MRVHQAYRYALDPTPDQAVAPASHCGAARYAFNWALGRVKAALEQRRESRQRGTLPRRRGSSPALTGKH